MLKTLKISFSLKNAYSVNGFLYSLKQIPILKKIIPQDIYGVSAFKVIGTIWSILKEIFFAFFGKLLYFVCLILLPVAFFRDVVLINASEQQLIMHILFFLTIIGGFNNNYIFSPSEEKYYAINLMRINAKEYTLVNYFYFIIKTIVGFSLWSFVFGMIYELSVIEFLLIPLFVAGTKLFFSAIMLYRYEKRMKNNKSENNAFIIASMLFFLLIAYGLPFLNVIFPSSAYVILMLVVIILGILSLKIILTFSNYQFLCKKMLTEYISKQDSDFEKIQVEATRNAISTFDGETSKRKGFEYLNEIFVKRHKKILWKSSWTISIISACIFAIIVIALFFSPEFKREINGMMLGYLPYMAFVMYLINRGTNFTQALFVNCDHCFLTYSFYKKPENILKLFWIRLREITKINLLPAVVIGISLSVLLLISGGTDNALNYAVIFVSVVMMSIFFSVHYLTLYYLLQPYNTASEIKSGTYNLVTRLTYLVCYFLTDLTMKTLTFGIMTIIFCVGYCLVASILVYFLAPKKFRIHN